MLDFGKETTKHIIRQDGRVTYYGRIFKNEEADILFKNLFDKIEWRNDEAFIYGKHYITKRKVAWYGEKPYPYSYSNTTKTALPFTSDLIAIKSKVEEFTGAQYNSCLLNLYHDGSEGMAWHSDDEKELKKDGSIASISFGAERKFSFKHKETEEKVDCLLEHGSLLEMAGACQTWWRHRLPPSKKVLQPRINLTFRIMNESKS